jgi:exonuclease SbcC
MLLKSLKLENIRSYTHQVIDFNDGSTLLIGDIGSGKTTILLAVEFAFFGLIKGDVNGSTLLRHGKHEGSVELRFSIDDKEIRVLRKLKRGKDDTVSQDSGQITVNNKIFDGTPIELKSRILELFGYPEELLNKNTGLIYRYTVYTPQEDMKKILFESKDDRLDTLRKIFNIDKYKRIRENALAYAKELRNTKKIIEGKISDLEQLKQTLEEQSQLKVNTKKKLDEESVENNVLKKSYESKTAELKRYEEDISVLKILKKDLEIAIINLKNKQQELQKNSKDLGMIEYRINEYTSKLQEYGDAVMDEQSVNDSLSDAEGKLDKIRAAKEFINKKLEDKERDLQNLLVEDFAALKYKQQVTVKRLEEKEDKEKLLEVGKDVLERTIIELNIINVNKHNSTKVINQLKDLSTCPICLQTVDFTHKVKILDRENANIQSCERRFSEFSTKKKELEDKVNTLKLEIEELRKMEMDLKEISMKLTNISTQQDTKNLLQKEVEELKLKKNKLDGMDINKLMDTISKGRKLLRSIDARKHIEESLKIKFEEKKEASANIARIEKELKEFSDRRKDVEDNISKYTDIEKEYAEKNKELGEIVSLLKESDIRVTETKKDIESIEKEISRVNRDIEAKNKLKMKAQYISELNYWITEHFVNLTATMEKIIMQKIQIEFNELFQKWFNMLIEDENIEVRVDDEFTPVISQNNYETEITNLSGGEKTSIALAYRLALNKVINDLINNIKTKDLIILDEPTDGFSSEQLDKMRDVLHELNIKQLIMVSHEAKMESFVQNIIRVNKNEHSSQIIV